MNELKAWRINGAETWSGRDAEEAIMACLAAHGPHARRKELLDDEDDGPEEVDRETVVYREPGDDQPKTTVGAILDAMDGPGYVCGTEY